MLMLRCGTERPESCESVGSRKRAHFQRVSMRSKIQDLRMSAISLLYRSDTNIHTFVVLNSITTIVVPRFWILWPLPGANDAGLPVT